MINPATSAQTDVTATFILTVLSDCVLTTINNTPVNDMTSRVVQTPGVQTVDFSDYISDLHADTNYCGSRSFTLSPVYPFLKQVSSGVTTVLTLWTDDPRFEGFWDVQLTIAIPSYPTINPIVKNFQVHIECEILVAEPLIQPV